LSGVSFTDLQHGFVSGDGALYITSDGGETWARHNLEMGPFYDVYFYNATKGWAIGTSDGLNGKLFRTDDGGETWEKKSNSQMYPLYDICFVDEEKGWAAGGAGEIMFTEDGGYTWNSQISPVWQEWYSMSFIDDQKGWICGGQQNNGYIIHTDNGGNTWEVQYSGQVSRLKSIFFVDELYGWAGGLAGVLYKTTDGGLNWNSLNTGASGRIESIYFVSAQKGWIVTYSGEILLTENGGDTWSVQFDGYEQFKSVFFIDPEIGWVAGGIGSPVILHTTDGGNSWNTQYEGTIYSGLNDIGFSSLSNGYAVGDNALLRTYDGGETWTEEEYYTPEYNELFAISTFGSRSWISGNWGLILNKGTSETAVFVAERGKASDFSLSIYPNPVGDFFHINSEKSFKTIKIYEVTGRIVKTEDVIGKVVNVSKLDKGIYLVELITLDRESIFVKMIKQ
jgi:photosystem II stability/assembly factor-like uncharacterized protein